jgi:hypothetical protein
LVGIKLDLQRTLGHFSPVDIFNDWRKKKPELFNKRVYKQAELDR